MKRLWSAGFLRFDPAKVQFMEVREVPLRPEAAAVGLEVRVVGNDSGEKARLSLAPPCSHHRAAWQTELLRHQLGTSCCLYSHDAWTRR